MVAQSSSPSKETLKERLGQSLKDLLTWRYYWDAFRKCWNIPTILLLIAVFAMNWAFRTYCLKKPVDWSPLEWEPMTWVIFDSIVTFFLLRCGWWFRYPVLILVSFLGAVHLTTTHLYRHMLHYGMLASVFETNASETSEFLDYVGWYPFVVFAVLLLVFWALTFKASRYGLIGTLMLLGVSLYPVIEIAVPAMMGDADKEAYEFAHFPMEKMKQRFVNSTVFRIPTMVGQYVSIHSRMILASYRDRVLPDGVTYHPAAVSPDIPRRIIFVLGESDWRGHHGAYGYPHGTDHFMMARRGNPANTAFFNGISPASVTRDAISRLFTFATARNVDPFNENMGIVDMAKNAGYQTGWYSRQNWSGIYDTLVKIVAQQADETVYYDQGHDEVLVPPLMHAIKAGKRQFLVIHIWGSHMGYGERHDASDYKAASGSPKPYRRYDATIAHTDKVLAEVSRLADSSTLFVYVPDHGEIINMGHGLPDLIGSQFEVPLIAWSSNTRYISRFRKIVARYAIADGALFNTSALPFVMAEMMGYYVTEKTRAQSLQDSRYIFNVDGYPYPVSRLENLMK